MLLGKSPASIAIVRFMPRFSSFVGHYYVLFAAEAGSTSALIAELAGMTVFVALAVAGFKFTPWLIPAGLAGHGVFDLAHGYLVTNPGVPTWWPAFCGTYDVVIGAAVAALLIRGRANQQRGALPRK